MKTQSRDLTYFLTQKKSAILAPDILLLIFAKTWLCLSSFVYFSPTNKHLLSAYHIPCPHYIRYWRHNIKQGKQSPTSYSLESNKRKIILQTISIYSLFQCHWQESTFAMGIHGDHLLWTSRNPIYWSSVVNNLIYSYQRKSWSFVQYLRRKTLNHWAR